jgi:protein-tyrosine-phosphatase
VPGAPLTPAGGAKQKTISIMKILFLCTGNTCRSVLAHQFAAKLAADEKLNIEVVSAGLAADEAIPQPPAVRKLLLKEGVPDYQHKPSMFTCEAAAGVSLIIAMTAAQKEDAIARCPDAAAKTFTLMEYAGYRSDDIPDPFGRDDLFYYSVFSTIKTAVRAVIARLKKG